MRHLIQRLTSLSLTFLRPTATILVPIFYTSTGVSTAGAAFTSSLTESRNSSRTTFVSQRLSFSSKDNTDNTKNKKSMSTENSDNADNNTSSKALSGYKVSSDDNAGPTTVFDKILSGEWSSQKVYEDEKAYAFRDINPQAPVHVLVIPKVRDGLVQIRKARADQKELLGHLMYVAQEIGKKECPDGFRIVINDGEEGQQTVFHLHLHVLGGRQLTWPPG